MKISSIPLHAKLSFMTSLFLCVFGLVIIFISNTIINDQLTEKLKNDTTQLMSALDELTLSILLFESEIYSTEFEETINNFPHITSASVQTLSGAEVANVEKDKKAYEEIILTSTIRQDLIDNHPMGLSSLDADGEKFKTIGTFTVGISTDQVKDTQSAIVRGVSIACATFLLIISLSFFLLSRRILDPLQSMARTMDKYVQDSKFTGKAHLSNVREFNAIAVAYNTMMEHIQTVNHNLDSTNQNLLQEMSEKDLAFGREKKLEEQLFQSQKLEAIGRMTAAISHDFNNILGGILGFSKLALDEVEHLDQQIKKSNLQQENPLDFDDLVDSLEEIQKGGTRAKAIIRQLLVFSRKAETKPEPLDLSEPLRSLYPFLKTSIPSTIGFTINSKTARKILIDPTHFEQIILNLVINARDAVGTNGEIDIQISDLVPGTEICASCKDVIKNKDHPYIKVSVKDNGPGIAEEHLQQIFDPFFSTKDKDKGTGMGLSIIHGLVHKNKGHIVVDTSPEGTQFSLFFPQHYDAIKSNTADCDKKNTKVQSPRAESPTLNRSLKSSKPLLLVDDNEQFLKFMRRLLTNEGYTVVAHSSPTKALTDFIDNKGDYLGVISDYLMPGISGAELCMAILRYSPQTNIIICSGYNDDLHDANAAIPNAAYFTKPIDQDEFLERISSFGSTDIGADIRSAGNS